MRRKLALIVSAPFWVPMYALMAVLYLGIMVPDHETYRVRLRKAVGRDEVVNLAEKIQQAPDGPVKDLGIVLVEAMRDYFQACADANAAQKRAATAHRESIAREVAEREARGKFHLAEYLEEHIVRLAGPVEELLDA